MMNYLVLWVDEFGSTHRETYGNEEIAYSVARSYAEEDDISTVELYQEEPVHPKYKVYKQLPIEGGTNHVGEQ